MSWVGGHLRAGSGRDWQPGLLAQKRGEWHAGSSMSRRCADPAFARLKRPRPDPQLRSHAFGSPHTVDYCGVGGSAATVDNCYKTAEGCDQSGTTFSGNYGQLPACTGPTPHWPSTGKGVIMSYVSGKGELAW